MDISFSYYVCVDMELSKFCVEDVKILVCYGLLHMTISFFPVTSVRHCTSVCSTINSPDPRNGDDHQSGGSTCGAHRFVNGLEVLGLQTYATGDDCLIWRLQLT